jgi:hypothetical protein
MIAGDWACAGFHIVGGIASRRVGPRLVALTALLRPLRTGPQSHEVLLASFLETHSDESWCSLWPQYRGGA